MWMMHMQKNPQLLSRKVQNNRHSKWVFALNLEKYQELLSCRVVECRQKRGSCYTAKSADEDDMVSSGQSAVKHINEHSDPVVFCLQQ